jgi:hypothetical protein
MVTAVLKTTVRVEVAERAKEKAKMKNLSLSNYLCRLVERDLGSDEETFTLEDRENDLKECKNSPVYHSAEELFEDLHRGHENYFKESKIS